MPPFHRPLRIRLQAKHYSLNSVPETPLGRFHPLITTSAAIPLAVTWLTLLRHAGHSPARKKAPIQGKSGPEPLQFRATFALLATYAAICFTSGAVVLTSILRGNAAAAMGAMISNTPFTYSAVSFSTFTPSGSARVLSNTP